MSKQMSFRKKQAIWNKTGGKCYYCGVDLDDFFHSDHVISQSRGGSNSIENQVPACQKCNCSKGTKTIEEFRRMLACRVRFSINQIVFLQELGLWSQVESFIDNKTSLIKFWYENH